MDIVPDLLCFAGVQTPHKPAVVEGERCLTFAQVHERAERLLQVLGARGMQAGDRLALLAKNEVEYLEIQVAAMRGQYVLVPINFRLAEPEVAYILSDCGARALITGPEYARVPAPAAVAQRLTLGPDYETALAAATATAEVRPPIAARAPCTILYTSGTTGRPKGAVLSNYALHARITTNLFEYQVRSEDRFLQCLPLFHIASNVTYTYAYAGATNVLLKDFHPLAVLDLVPRHAVTSALLVPTMINALINQPEVAQADLSSLHTMAYGASPIPPAVLEKAIALLGCGFLQLFGMTETSACTTLRRGDHDPVRFPRRLASAGTETIGMEVRIVDDADTEVPQGRVGEIVCRGPAVMDGYWNAPEATADALRGGWMHTGDLGYRDSDGYVFVTDRKKDMIISGGENVYPREVEDVLFEHADVLEAAVIGVPDERWGERVHAVVVPRRKGTLDLDALLAFARTRLAGYKVPKSAQQMAELPKNATGKVLKTVLRERFSDARG